MPFDRERAQLDAGRCRSPSWRRAQLLMFPEHPPADGEIHEFKAALDSCAAPVDATCCRFLIRGTHDVMGKGSLVSARHPVEVGSVAQSNSASAELAETEGAGAYRKIAGLMRTAVIALFRFALKISGASRQILPRRMELKTGQGACAPK